MHGVNEDEITLTQISHQNIIFFKKKKKKIEAKKLKSKEIVG